MSKEIPLTKGKVAIVDDEDYPELSKYKWRYDKGYAVRTAWINGKSKIIYMHRQILGLKGHILCDHANRNTLDNRRANLRAATKSQNASNSKVPADSKSGYKGVTWYKRTCKWRASITLHRKHMHLGYFDNIDNAVQAYNSKALELFGEFANINQIKEVI